VSASIRAPQSRFCRAAMVQFSRPSVVEEIFPAHDPDRGKCKRVSSRSFTSTFAPPWFRNILGTSPLRTIRPDRSLRRSLRQPAGQSHEFGALAVAVTRILWVWRSVYAGPSLPRRRLCRRGESCGARAVALSIVHPVDDRASPRRSEGPTVVRDNVVIFVGGRSRPGFDRRGEEPSVVFVTISARCDRVWSRWNRPGLLPVLILVPRRSLRDSSFSRRGSSTGR